MDAKEKNLTLFYIKDAIKLMLNLRDENIKINPIKFLSKYFNSVKIGSHVLLREYSYTTASLYNRTSFIKLYYRCFLNVWKSTEGFSVDDYHSLALLICHDFPVDVIYNALSISSNEQEAEKSINFSDFLFLFQLYFCYTDFIVKCEDIYTKLFSTKSVIMSSSNEDEKDDEGIESPPFYDQIVQISHNPCIDCPSDEILQNILLSRNYISFSLFIKLLSDSLNSALGVLPNQNNLLKMSEREVYLCLGESSQCLDNEAELLPDPSLHLQNFLLFNNEELTNYYQQTLENDV